MSLPDSTDPGSPKSFDLLSAMLAVALVAIIIAIVVLAMELGRYEWDIGAETAPRAVSISPMDPTFRTLG